SVFGRDPEAVWAITIRFRSLWVRQIAEQPIVPARPAQMLLIPAPRPTTRQGEGRSGSVQQVYDITVIGIGTGNPQHLTLEAIAALEAADIVLVPDKGDEK